jgi:hypothetical protein
MINTVQINYICKIYMDWIGKIIGCFETDSVYYTQHARKEMEEERFGEIHDSEVYEALCNSEIIEEYLEDKPYPSVLIFGRTNLKRPLHIVCAYNEEETITIIVTAYQPDPDRWVDFKRRRKE